MKLSSLVRASLFLMLITLFLMAPSLILAQVKQPGPPPGIAPANFRLPFIGTYNITQGPCYDHLSGGSPETIDFNLSMRTIIVATEAGIVSAAENQGTGGNVVKIDHADNFRSIYAHVDEFIVKKGDRVSKGQPIAWSGKTGTGTGPHLHFAVAKMVKGQEVQYSIRQMAGVKWTSGDPNKPCQPRDSKGRGTDGTATGPEGWMAFQEYCTKVIGGQKANHRGNPYSWYCDKNGQAIPFDGQHSTNAVCLWQTSSNNASSYLYNNKDPYSWTCRRP